jgi:hypothetical protein
MPKRKSAEEGALYFRIYPEYKRLYYDVYIWSSHKLMRANLRNIFSRKELGSVLACVVTFEREYRKSPTHLGDIHFNRDHLDRSIVGHEATHAGLSWACRVRLDLTQIRERGIDKRAHPAEERLCDAIGAIVHQVEEAIRISEWRDEPAPDKSRLIYES